MKLCAYCKCKKKLTREHVIPDWFINIDQSEDDRTFSERAPNKFVNDLVVRDVCRDCNNNHLSKLNSYGKGLHERYFQNYVYKDQDINFEYDYQKLLKWLLKCSYNSARVNNADLEVLHAYSDLLISETPIPDDVITFCALVAPSTLNGSNGLDIADKKDASEVYEPSWFRLGVFRVPEFDSVDYCFRTVIIGSYSFFIALPKIGSDHLKERYDLLTKIRNAQIFGTKLSPIGSTKLGAPIRDAISSFAGQILNNPNAYELRDDDFSKHLKESDVEKIVHIISRKDVESQNTFEIEEFFSYLTSSRETALLCMQKVEFCIHGYDDDTRELYQINEVVRYVGKLNKIFPYWLFYNYTEGAWIKVLLSCLSKPETAAKEGRQLFISMDSSLLVRHIERWLISLNEFSHRFSISERINRKISDDFDQLIKRFVPADL